MNLNLNEKQLSELLKIAGEKLGTSPQKLENELKSGKFDKALFELPKGQAEMLKAALSDPKKAQAILQTPQAQAIYKKLSEG